jgi:hypothetical protein
MTLCLYPRPPRARVCRGPGECLADERTDQLHQVPATPDGGPSGPSGREGVSRGTVYGYFRGSVTPQPWFVRAMIEVLELSEDEWRRLLKTPISRATDSQTELQMYRLGLVTPIGSGIPKLAPEGPQSGAGGSSGGSPRPPDGKAPPGKGPLPIHIGQRTGAKR